MGDVSGIRLQGFSRREGGRGEGGAGRGEGEGEGEGRGGEGGRNTCPKPSNPHPFLGSGRYIGLALTFRGWACISKSASRGTGSRFRV